MMELPVLLIFLFFVLRNQTSLSAVTWVFVAAFSIHYIHRAIIFPFRIKTSGKKMPLFVALMAIAFNTVNGTLNGYYFGVIKPGYPPDWISDPRFIVGILLFVGGMLINLQSDNILLSLRKQSDKGYQIPRGGFYRFISCPNFFGEIIEWIGFAMMSWSLPALSFAVWSAINLIPRAVDHHKWYKEKFEDYPAERKAVIPFIL
jgi:protein-S-isoprenylcysteine O-methyltransferase Ste14